jgi:hypothetical protein
MERIKKALDDARAMREQALRDGTSAAGIEPRLDAATEHRIRELMLLRELPAAQIEATLALGQVFSLAPGDTVFAAGDINEHAHFLIEGAVQYADGARGAWHLGAEEPDALLPLDEPGAQRWTLTAERPALIFRVPRALLDPEPQRVASTPAEKGRDQRPESAEERTQPWLGRKPGAPAMEESWTGFRSQAALLASSPETGGHARLDAAFGVLEQRLRRHVEEVRAQERAAAEVKLRRHIEELKLGAQAELRRRFDELKQRAESELRRKLTQLRSRDRDLLLQNETRLRERHAQLQRVAKRYAQQQNALQHVRRQLEEKLHAADAMHRELYELGRNVSLQLEDLDQVFDADDDQASPPALPEA